MTATPERAIAPAPVADQCANCALPRAGPYCSRCGQPAQPGRLTTRDVFRRHVAGAIDLDRGMLHTADALFRNPGAVLRDYFRGRTIPYTNPVKYFLVIMSLFQIITLTTDQVGDFVSGLAENFPELGNSVVVAFIEKYTIAIATVFVPLAAVFQRVVFRRASLNLAEHLVFALFIMAQIQLLVMPTAMIDAAGRGLFARGVVYTLNAAALGYYVLAARQTFGYSWAGTVGRCASVFVLTTLSYTAVIMGVLFAVAR